MELDLKKINLRDVNDKLQNLDRKQNQRDFTIINPEGNHAICAGLTEEMNITIKGHVGYYCAGMNQKAQITIDGNAGTGVAENMMSGKVHVKGNASQSAGATAHGGLLIIDGDASSRCGISMKGVDIKMLINQVPGGMLSILEKQLLDLNKSDKLDDLVKEIPRIRKDVGYIPLVTPTSQIIGAQALLKKTAPT